MATHDKRSKNTTDGPCQHCKREGYRMARDLCRRCYLDPEIRNLYQVAPNRPATPEDLLRRSKLPSLTQKADQGLPLF